MTLSIQKYFKITIIILISKFMIQPFFYNIRLHALEPHSLD